MGRRVPTVMRGGTHEGVGENPPPRHGAARRSGWRLQGVWTPASAAGTGPIGYMIARPSRNVKYREIRRSDDSARVADAPTTRRALSSLSSSRSTEARSRSFYRFWGPNLLGYIGRAAGAPTEHPVPFEAFLSGNAAGRNCLNTLRFNEGVIARGLSPVDDRAQAAKVLPPTSRRSAYKAFDSLLRCAQESASM